MLLQLGDQLIRNENIAISELVKNAYDADASRCLISCVNINDSKKGKISIWDDGVGMTLDTVLNVWLEPGADFKNKLLEEGEQATFDFDFIRPKRLPIGEKGVGRFGAHKIGSKVELITRSSNAPKEIRIFIDWEDFEANKYLDEAGIIVEERKPELFIGDNHGTQITISGLKQNWTQKMYKDFVEDVVTLMSPFDSDDSFTPSVELELDDKDRESKWKQKGITLEDIHRAALWEVHCRVEGDAITMFEMKFKPWEDIDVPSRMISLADIQKDKKDKIEVGRGSGEMPEGVNLTDKGVGTIEFYAYVFDLDSDTLRFIPEISPQLKSYLAKNGGIRVYRDRLRIYDYGEAGNDWLDLDKRRINNPVRQIGNRNILGAASLDRKSSRGLIEKTNREGFVDNEAYKTFADAVRYVVDLIGTVRIKDKEAIKKVRSAGKKVTEKRVVDAVEDLKESLSENLAGVDFAGKEGFLRGCVVQLDEIEEQYIRMNEILLKSSNMGLSFGIVVHEVDKRLSRLRGSIELPEVDIDNLRIQIEGISDIVKSYAAIASTDIKQTSVKKAVDVALMNVEFRLKAHKIDLIRQYANHQDTEAKLSLNNIVGVMINIFDNSIYWLNKYEIEEPKIFVSLKEYEHEVGIVIADNGNGFSIPFEDALQPFFTDKVIGGQGLGLHIASETMRMHGGKIIQRSASEVDELPNEFANGAIIELILKKER